MDISNIELLLENNSNNVFPLVSQYIDGNLSSIKYKETDKVKFIKKVNIVNNSFEITKNIDFLHSIEITGLLN